MAAPTQSQGGRVTPYPLAAYVTIASANPKLEVSAILDENQPKMSGFGGWTVIARPRRVSMIDWTGVDPYRLMFGLMLDAWSDAPQTVEQDCLNLERMARPGPQNQRPPSVRITDGMLPHMDLIYVIEALDWGDVIRQRDTGKRVRAVAALTLLATGDATPSSPAAANRSASAGRGGQAHPLRYTVKKGDTLSTIAASNYGDASQWHAIAAANNIRDPKALKVGQVLKLP